MAELRPLTFRQETGARYWRELLEAKARIESAVTPEEAWEARADYYAWDRRLMALAAVERGFFTDEK